MSTQKRKPKSVHDLLSYMYMLEDGLSFCHIHKNYGINEERLKVLWLRYQKEGISGLQKQQIKDGITSIRNTKRC
ncbi:hypothetical protein C3V43_11295 [Bacteroides heparinolyticus]|nr:hypothetical protein C3V43_11295 [Bacteroides heparinolyticus]